LVALTLAAVLFYTLLFLLVVALILVVVAVIRHAPRPVAARALETGTFAVAVEAVSADPLPEDLVPAAIASRHLLAFPKARALLDGALLLDPEDGEIWLEYGLVQAYENHLEGAVEALSRAAALRPDLAEAVTLHLAWIALRRGRVSGARRLFEEIEAPLENKLRFDLGVGEPIFSDWFLQAGDLWEAFGEKEKAKWARNGGRRSAPASRLPAAVFFLPKV
jgi:tetratricopeptide (TPR) repeat protein